MTNQNIQTSKSLSKLGTIATSLNDAVKIAKSALIIAMVAATFYGAVIYAKIYIFDIKQYPDFSLHELLTLGLLSFAWIGFVIAVFYACCEVILLNVRQLKVNLKKGCLLVIVDVIFTLILIAVQILLNMLIISLLGASLYLSVIISVLISLFAVVLSYTMKDKFLKFFRFYLLFTALLVCLQSNISGLEKAHIANFQADITTRMTDDLELELANYGIYELPSCADGAEQICIAKKGFIKIKNANVKANFGKFVFVDLEQKEGKAIPLKLLAEHVKFLIK